MSKTVFISGIDTNIGKTIATGLLARELIKLGRSVITQKIVQTGCTEIAEDIVEHRRLMGIDLQAVDMDLTTCPFVFPLAASPHLAASDAKREIDLNVISKATQVLENKYDIVLLEGAGGLCVPINSRVTIIDYISERNYPLILLTSSRLGSINHTLLSLEVIFSRGIQLKGLIYNRYPKENQLIVDDSKAFFEDYLQRHFPKVPLIELTNENSISNCNLDISNLNF